MSRRRVLLGVLVAGLMAAAAPWVSSSANAGSYYYGQGYGHYYDDDDNYLYRYKRPRYKCYLPEKYLCGPHYRRHYYPRRYRGGYGLHIRPYYHAYPSYQRYYGYDDDDDY
jgi:hypothetical protein